MFQQLTHPLSVWFQTVTDRWTGKAPPGAQRSSEWSGVRDAFLAEHPQCACCGGTTKLRVHHVEPFHVNPARELDPANLITLCEAGKYGINCHLLLGHLGNWQKWNPLCRLDALRLRLKLSGRCTALLEELRRSQPSGLVGSEDL